MLLEDALAVIERAGQMAMTRRESIVTLLRVGRTVGAAALLPLTDSVVYTDPYKVLQDYFLRDKPDLRQQVNWGLRVDDDPSNSLTALRSLPFRDISERLDLEKRGRVTILYPGAGLHYAMLDVGRGLAEQVPALSVDFIYTEYAKSRENYDHYPQTFREYMTLISQYIRILEEHETPNLDRGKETTFTLDAFGQRMTLMYAVNRSDKGADHSFFRRQYAEDSDILVSHDSFSDKLPIAVEKFCLWGAIKGEQRVIIFEDIARVAEGKSPLEVYAQLPGEFLLIEGDYGCLYKRYKGLIVYFPDNRVILELDRNGQFNHDPDQPGEFAHLVNSLFYRKRQESPKCFEEVRMQKQ